MSVATLAGAGVGLFTLGANGTIRVKVDETRPFAPTERTLELSTRHQPTPAELEAAARS